MAADTGDDRLTNTQVLLRRRPQGIVTPEDFTLHSGAVPEPGAGEVLVRHSFFSLDPYMRGRMNDAKSYSAPVAVGAVMESQAVGTVERSNDPGFVPGDAVLGGYGWQEWSAVPAARLRKLPDGLSPSLFLGVLGMPGLTAYVGMARIGQPKENETVVVSAASGAVGAVVGQIAKAAGARVVGVAGGAEKCAFVTGELGFDTCIDHRAPGLAEALDAACPEGIDIYWENVGGAVQAAAFPRLRDFGRVVMCGMVSEYNDTAPAPGPNLMSAVRKRLRIEGFIVSDHWPMYGGWLDNAGPMIRDGRMKFREDVVAGIANAPAAFIGMLAGRNFGKLVIKL